jgi:hypothetical protein
MVLKWDSITHLTCWGSPEPSVRSHGNCSTHFFCALRPRGTPGRSGRTCRSCSTCPFLLSLRPILRNLLKCAPTPRSCSIFCCPRACHRSLFCLARHSPCARLPPCARRPLCARLPLCGPLWARCIPWKSGQAFRNCSRCWRFVDLDEGRVTLGAVAGVVAVSAALEAVDWFFGHVSLLNNNR